MAQFKYDVAQDVLSRFPGYRLGVAIFDKVDNCASDPALEEMLREAEQRVRKQITGNVAEHQSVAAWRHAYRAFGAKPAEYRSSIESLLRRVLKPDNLPVFNPLVDIGTIISLRHLLPAGVHPIRGPDSRIELRFAREGDRFLAAEADPPEVVAAGEVVLADQVEVLTRRWTWRQSVTTRTLATSTTVFFNVDGLPLAGADRVEDALQEIRSLVRRFCGGDLVFSGVLSSEVPGLSVELV